MTFTVRLLGGAAPLALLAAANPAFAAADVTPAAADQTTSAGTGQSDNDTIVVTARRRAETAQDVPLAISVVGGDHIDNTGAFNVGRLQQLTPTLQFTSTNPRNTSVNIRGIGAPIGLTNDGIEQGVGIYVDDVYMARVASSTFDFLDVKQIEVLRGPQGTLYGKNTTAGAINITSRQPTFDFEGRAEASVGNLGFTQFKAAVSGPLSETVAVRVAGSLTNRNGTLLNAFNGHKVNEQDNLGLRAQVLFKPSSSVEVTLAGDFSRQNPECCAQLYVRTGATQRPLARQYDALAAAQGYVVPSTNPYDRITDVDATLRAKNQIGGVSLRVKAETGLGTFTSITAWRTWDWDPSNDRDFIGLPITTKSNNPSKQDQYTQEFRLSGEKGKLGYVLGAFGFYQKIQTNGIQQQGSAASKWLINPTNPLSNVPAVLDGLTANNDIRFTNTSAALFGKLTWKVADGFSIQPGFRLNYDKKNGDYNSVVTDGQGNLVVFEVDSTGKSLNSNEEKAQLAVLAPQAFIAKFSDWNFSYDVTASYDVTPDIHLYATYAKSFKTGGINLNGVPADTAGVPLLALATVKPESVNHYEAGIKTQFLDRKATFNVAIFRTEIGNYQAQVSNYTVGALRGYLANADKARTQGVEVDWSYRPSERFNVYGNGAFTDATYRKFTNAPCPPELSGGSQPVDANGNLTATPSAPGTPGVSPLSCDISGQRLPGVSRWSASFGAEANLPVNLLGKDGQVYLGFDGNYRSSWSSNPSPSAYTWVKGYALSNFRLGVRSDAGFDIFGWVRNAFDVNYIDQLSVASGNTGLIVGNVGDPRTWGATVKLTF
ncbi:TonB-dependent receptor [Novosphingobium cyanobacteriorum]|uniref:TonB-dependent receptor n=1 Tax=Novosphingobium cyanobacteriorum TaxID=3024215 RepID=A0ABT6CIX3_9SPHN|nr:TonB-dependent receptor [Novosphingobium cyanobacteriorum]MDF8333851.1 TonB-dependent receptor [Novosphingobium cyanobacteriorum]